MTEEHNDSKDLFVSYNKTDKKWVHNLAAQIESETIDGTPNIPIVTLIIGILGWFWAEHSEW